MPLSIYVIAGEASGDNLGAGLLRELKARLGAEVTFRGVGGEKMEEIEGFESLFPYDELSLMGFLEILPHAAKIMMRIHQVTEDILNKRPDVLITIDVPGFNLRVMEKLRKADKLERTKFIHYVAPTVWAYNLHRAAICARLFHHMLVLLPFEPPYFEAVGLPTTFVGHPVAFAEAGDGAAFRAANNIAPDAPLICLMPGSRKGEIKRHMAAFGKAINLLGAVHPDIALAVPVPKRLLPRVAMYFKGCPYRTVLLSGDAEKKNALAASTAAIVKSGTVSLEVAQALCPQIVTYRLGRLTARLLRKLLTVRFVNIINIMRGREVIPELLQERCTAEYLANALGALLQDAGLRERQKQAVRSSLLELRAPGGHPHALAAEAVLKVAGFSPPQGEG